jgi:hypothetical protein
LTHFSRCSYVDRMKSLVRLGPELPIALLVAFSLVPGSSGDAVMLCARPRSDGTFSTSLKIREACQTRETPLDPLALGLTGPPGPAGPPGPSPGFTCSSSCVSGYPNADFTCGGTQDSCSSPGGFATANARIVSCTTDDSLATSFCLFSKCGAGPCPGEPTSPSCVVTEAHWTITASIGYGNAGCNAVIPGTYTCEIAPGTSICRLGDQDRSSYQDYIVGLQEGPTPAMRWMPGDSSCTHTVLLGPGGAPVESVPVATADVRYYATGSFDPGFGFCGGGFCGVAGSFSAIGTCP